MWYIVGLGNPGEEYKATRHNAGRIALHAFQDSADEKFLRAKKVTLITPETFMNKSGDAVRGLVKSKKAAEQLVVLHDDLDIPFGSYKISFNKSSGGHRGVESVIKAVKTQAFVRVRIGICPVTPSGKLKKPHGEAVVEKLILGKFTPAQLAVLKKLCKKISEALTVLVSDGRDKAMSQYNG